MDDSTRSLAALMAFNTCFILGGISIILVEMGMVGAGFLFAIFMAMEGSAGYAISSDGWNRRLWDRIGGGWTD